MPVQKYACPNDTTAYDPGHSSARHTLFAGTTVLQAGISSDAAVHAVVTATGGCTAQKRSRLGECCAAAPDHACSLSHETRNSMHARGHIPPGQHQLRGGSAC